MAFSSFAFPVLADEQCEQKAVEIVSDTTNLVEGDGNAINVAIIHPAWTASIPGADWIWKTSATANNEIVAFEKDFTVEGATVLSATLDIATDNSYEVFIDDVLVASDPAENNFQLATQDTHDLLADVTTGAHTLRVEVKNIGTYNAESNPAGLLYKFVVESECCGDDEDTGGDDTVINKNSAYVKNVVSSKADSRDNWAGGSTGGDGGNGGSVSNAGEGNDADDNTTGNGGAGGNSGVGGTVYTGSAASAAGATTYANDNLTEIDRCACNGGPGDTFVLNKNRVTTKNIVRSKADSGDNSADGSTGGNGGSAGSVSNAGTNNDADNNQTGNGGDGGSNDSEVPTGGFVSTGDAVSVSSVLNKVNRNVTRIGR